MAIVCTWSQHVDPGKPAAQRNLRAWFRLPYRCSPQPAVDAAHVSCSSQLLRQPRFAKWGVEQFPGTKNRWSYPPVSSAPWLAGNSPWLVNHHWMCFFEPSLLDLGQKSYGFFEPSLKSLKTSHTSPSLISNIMFVKQKPYKPPIYFDSL